MKSIKIFTFLIFLTLNISALHGQTGEVLATANGKNYTAADLDPAGREVFLGQSKALADERIELLGAQIAKMLFKEESESRELRSKNCSK